MNEASLDMLAERADSVATLLKSLANRHRLLLLCTLSKGEYAVSELEETTGIGQPTLSRELGKLRAMELVTSRREAKAVFYQLCDEDARAVIDALCETFGPH